MNSDKKLRTSEIKTMHSRDNLEGPWSSGVDDIHQAFNPCKFFSDLYSVFHVFRHIGFMQIYCAKLA